MPSDSTNKPDHRQQVTDAIVALMEDGLAPWQKPWTPGGFKTPINTTSLTPYRGGNALYLLAEGLRRGYDDPRWMTYKQAQDKGWQVRKGEKGTRIEYWEFPGSKPREGDDTGEDGERRPFVIHRVYTVFNAAQIDGIPPYVAPPRQEWEVIASGEQILTNSGAAIRHDQVDRAFYSRLSDDIHLPPKEAFTSATGYYGTALHELAHWTGHPDRLNRLTLDQGYIFGSPAYAREELRAELASVFLAAERGIPYAPQQSAAYLKSWIGALKGDKHEIFRAATDAQAATNFLLALETPPAPERAASPPTAELPAPPPDTAAGYTPDVRGFDTALARRAYAGSSWAPEERAEQDRQGLIDHLRALYHDLAPLAATDAQQTTLHEQLALHTVGYLDQYHALLAAKADPASTRPTRRTSSPITRHAQQQEAEARRNEAFRTWLDQDRAVIRAAILGATAHEHEPAQRDTIQPPGVDELCCALGVRAVRNHALDRLQLFFDATPPFVTREQLKAQGWQWSHQYNAWQRPITPQAEAALQRFLDGQDTGREHDKQARVR